MSYRPVRVRTFNYYPHDTAFERPFIYLQE